MSERQKVLIVDDDEGVRFTLAEVLAEADVDVLEAADGEAGWVSLVRHEPQLVLTDLRMPRLDGLQLLERIHDEGRRVAVVVITAHGSEREAVRAMKLGAYDYLTKPFDVETVLAVVQRATERARLDLDNQRLRAELVLARHVVFRSPAMSRVARLVERAAHRDVTVLITGDSGTGKELVANALVSASHRADKPFVKFNCAAVPVSLAEAELFGHTANAFTGATRARPGVFREADGGTLFLDEIGELDLAIQGKLLRALQEGEVRPVGEDRPRPVDVRIIAATQRDLKKLVSAERFREDLFYRLNVVPVHLLPLAERPQDIDPLLDHFIRRHAQRFGIETPRLGAALRAQLSARPWPGNVRELENTLERLVALCSGSELDAADLDEALSETPSPLGLRERVEAFERELLRQELERVGGNRSEAARRLGIGRVTLLDKIKKYGL